MSAKLKLITNTLSTEQRIQNRIDAFRADMMNGDGDMEYVQQVMEIVYDYLTEFEDDDVFFAAMKTREAYFYLGDFINR